MGLQINVDKLKSNAGSDAIIESSSGYARIVSRKTTTKSASFAEASLTVSQGFSGPGGVILWDDVDPDSDANVLPAPPPPGVTLNFSYDPVTGIFTCTEPGEPNEYRVTVSASITTPPPGWEEFELMVMVGQGGPPVPVSPIVRAAINAARSPESMNLTTDVRLAPGDTLFVQVNEAGGGTIEPISRIRIQKLRDGT